MSHPRIGIGYDLHRTAPDRPLILGGLTIPAEFGLAGHSDADVVLHAVCDAIFGALGEPDIGEQFPDTEAAWAGADSRQFVEAARQRSAEAGYEVGNLDVIIHAQRPKLGAYKAQIRHELANILGVTPAQVAVKAKTNERCDAVGRGEALACWVAVVLVPDRASGG